MIKNILLIRNDRFGEFLLNIPAIRALKEAYPQARISLAVSPAVCELAGAVECVDTVAVWDEIKGSLRKHKFDLCVVLNPTKEAHWAVFWAQIPVRVGYHRKWGFLLTHKLADTKYLGDRHEVECNLELVGLVGAKNKEIARNDEVLRFPRNDKHEFLAQAIAIHPFTSDPVKQWPVERFMELAQRITREMGVKVVLVGRVENDLGKGIGKGRENPGIIDLINKTNLVELAQVLKHCRLLVTCDSGPMHLAATVGTPVIALFRNDLPGKGARRWGPLGRGHTVIEKADLEEISVDEVIAAIKLKTNR